MAIKLLWTNRNIQAVTTKIYRGASPLDRNNLGVLTPIATLTAGEVEYIDATVVTGQRYYYVFEVIAGIERVVSRNYEMWASPYVGPGPQIPIIGDFEHGFFGEVLTHELFSGEALSTALGFTAGTPYAPAANTNWMKFVRKGRVLYVPTMPLRVNINWANLYDAGLVYGVDSDGPYNSGTPRNQLRTVTKGRDSFIVRLPKGAPDGSNGLFTMPATKVLPPVETIGSEWDDLMYPIVTFFPSTQRRLNYLDKVASELHLNAYVAPCQERISGALTNHLIRGVRLTTMDAVTDIVSQVITSVSNLGWRPVLELIPTFTIDLNT